MAADRVNSLVAQLAQPTRPDAARLAAVLGAVLTPSPDNPYWAFYTFTLGQGPFAGGELRLSKTGAGAWLLLNPRDPPGLGEAEVDRAGWGPLVSLLPNPRIPPEGADTEVYELGGVTISVEWLHTSRRLRSLALEWQ